MTTTDQLWASYQELGNLRAVCRRHGLASHGALGQRLRRAGYTLHPVGVSAAGRRYTVEQLENLVTCNGSYAAASRVIGMSAAAIRMRINRARAR